MLAASQARSSSRNSRCWAVSWRSMATPSTGEGSGAHHRGSDGTARLSYASPPVGSRRRRRHAISAEKRMFFRFMPSSTMSVPARPQHPFETVIAVLAHEHTRLDELRQHLETAHRRQRLRDHPLHARTLADAVEPARQRRPGRRRKPVHAGGRVDVRHDREVGPAEALAVEVLRACRGRDRGSAFKPAICWPALAIISSASAALRAAEDADLEETPIDRLVLRVADLLERAGSRALDRGRRQHAAASATCPRGTRG